MKKVTLLGVIFLLIAVTAVPVMAANPGNGHGNGNNPGQGNNANTQDQTREQNQDQIKVKNRDRINHPGLGGNGNQMRMRTPFYLQGTITAVDVGTKMLTVELYHGNAQVKPYLGTTLDLQASETTLIFKITQGDDSDGEETEGSSNRVPITFDQLEVGQNVAIHGNVVDLAYNARLITVYVNMPIGQPVSEKP